MNIQSLSHTILSSKIMVFDNDELNNNLLKNPFIKASDISNISNEISGIQSDISNISNEISGIQSDISNINPEVSVIYSLNKDVSLSVNG
jgi:peptidoglycan hydrolase CwlO-like protein